MRGGAGRWIRHRVADGARNAAVALAPLLGSATADRIRPLIARMGPHLPILARVVADNMRAAGVYSPAVHRDYFAGLGEHFAGALQVLRCAARDRRRRPSPEFIEMVLGQVDLDESIHRLRSSLSAGRGAIILCPHVSNYFMNVARLAREVPLTAYMRYIKDERRQTVKENWCQVSGAEWISEPPGTSGPLGRMRRMAEAVNGGRALVVLLDLPQKRGGGVPVRFFNREIVLPAGAAVLAIRTGAEVFIMTARRCGRRQLLSLDGPLVPTGDRRQATRCLLQSFAKRLEEMLTEAPGLWYLWGDKRWSRVFRGDSRYVSKPDGRQPPVVEPASSLPEVA